jgi:hypothetical protein
MGACFIKATWAEQFHEMLPWWFAEICEMAVNGKLDDIKLLVENGFKVLTVKVSAIHKPWNNKES